jgi:hypothetical protein
MGEELEPHVGQTAVQRLVVCFERCRDEIGGGGRAVGQVEQRGGADQIVTRICSARREKGFEVGDQFLDRGETVAPCPRIPTSTSLHPPRAGYELTKVGGWQVEHGAPELERESRRPNSVLSKIRGSTSGLPSRP